MQNMIIRVSVLYFPNEIIIVYMHLIKTFTIKSVELVTKFPTNIKHIRIIIHFN